MYKKFTAVEGSSRRVRLAGMSFIGLLGYRSAREYCKQTVLGMADLDEDKLLLYSNEIDMDYEHIEENADEPFSGFWNMVVDAYVVPEDAEKARSFLQVEALQDAYESGKMSDSVEYLCVAGGYEMRIRAVYELEENDEGHVIVNFALINVNKWYEFLDELREEARRSA